MHLRLRSGDKPYSCDTFGRASAESGNLATHLRVHSGVKPFSCHACGKAFATAESLTAHLRAHSGDKPYSCDTHGASSGALWMKREKHTSSSSR